MNKKSLNTLHDLIQQGLVNENEATDLQAVVAHFSLAISDQMHQLIDKTDAEDPIAKQFVPSIKELNVLPNERVDPIGDEVHKAVEGIVHRYPDRCLFTPIHVCPVYCRFCFRREKVGEGSETLTPKELENAYAYLNEHTEIWEVILTGGDPLILKPAYLKKIIDRLSEIKHVEVIRIHTRVPVVQPYKINDNMVDALTCKKPVYVVLHANHAKEFTDNAIKACNVLVDAGIPMLSQTVLLKDINDNIEALSTLMRCFIKNRIKPYYLHHGDLALGTQHFRTTIQVGQELIKQLRGRFSGLCQPTYVLDIPGGHGKTPIGPNYLSVEEEIYQIEDYCGNKHSYSKK
jgi:lysine 2,3-aminomutase